jgi:hypothetical protein
MNNGDKPVSVMSDVEDHISIHRIGTLKRAANFVNIVPSDFLDNGNPRFYFIPRIWVLFTRLAQMLAGNNMH